MPTDENKRKHLEFIQDVINRMARNSFLLKSWTVFVVAAIIAFIARNGDTTTYLFFPVSLVVIAFWCLDGFFLRQERLFRALYDQVRTLDEADIDFSMDTRKYAEDSRNRWIRATLSKTLSIFYVPFALVVFLVLIL